MIPAEAGSCRPLRYGRTWRFLLLSCVRLCRRRHLPAFVKCQRQEIDVPIRRTLRMESTGFPVALALSEDHCYEPWGISDSRLTSNAAERFQRAMREYCLPEGNPQDARFLRAKPIPRNSLAGVPVSPGTAEQGPRRPLRVRVSNLRTLSPRGADPGRPNRTRNPGAPMFDTGMASAKPVPNHHQSAGSGIRRWLLAGYRCDCQLLATGTH